MNSIRSIYKFKIENNTIMFPMVLMKMACHFCSRAMMFVLTNLRIQGFRLFLNVINN